MEHNFFSVFVRLLDCLTSKITSCMAFLLEDVSPLFDHLLVFICLLTCFKNYVFACTPFGLVHGIPTNRVVMLIHDFDEMV